jgi:Tol biopolymer transport system component
MVIACVLALCASAGARTFPGANGRLAYVAGNQVFTMAANGGDVRQLTRDPVGAGHPDWSPDGRSIAYDTAGHFITVAAADGSGAHTVTTDFSALDPSWSPDSKALAFTGPEYDENGNIENSSIYVVAADGSVDHRIGPGSEPDWSPRGDWIVYLSNPARSGGCAGLFRMHSDGSGNSPVVPAHEDDGTCTGGGDHPSFSPDGKRIAFVSADRRAIYTVGLGGRHRKLVYRDGRVKSSPVFSPDGTRIAYSTLTGGTSTWTASARGGHVRRATGGSDQLAWQPLPR